MPLVSQQTIENWFTTDSWVYRNFAFLFKNPLWNKSVPRGFSLCPFFWLALFSLLIFRPFVGIILMVRWTCRLLRLNRALHQLDVWASCFWENKSSINVLGYYTVKTFGVVCFGICCLAMVGILGWTVHHFFATEVGTVFPWYVPLGLLVALAICGAHYQETKNDPNRCRVEYYLRLLVVLALFAAIVFHGAELLIVIKGLLFGIATAFKYIGTSIVWLAHWVWFGLVSLFSAALYGALGAIIGVVIASILGFLLWRFVPLDDYVPRETKELRQHQESIFQDLEDAYWSASPYGRKEARRYRFYLDALISTYILTITDGYNKIPVEKVRKAFSNITRDHEAAVKEAEARALAHKNLCAKYSSLAARLFSPFTWFGKQAHTFFSVTWITLKGLKQGACPYVMFKEVPTDKKES